MVSTLKTKLLLIVLICGCTNSQITSEKQIPATGSDLGVEFQVVKSDDGAFSNECLQFKGSLDETSKMSPLEGFQFLKTQKGTPSKIDGRSVVFVRLKGELYTIDKFEFVKAEVRNGHCTNWVLYQRKIDEGLLPAPAKAYVKIILPDDPDTVAKIRLLQCTDEFQPLKNFDIEQE